MMFPLAASKQNRLPTAPSAYTRSPSTVRVPLRPTPLRPVIGGCLKAYDCNRETCYGPAKVTHSAFLVPISHQSKQVILGETEEQMLMHSIGNGVSRQGTPTSNGGDARLIAQ